MSTFTTHHPEWKPHGYQQNALSKMFSQRAVGLFMDPGLGKTSTVLAAFKQFKEQGLVDKMLIIAPLRIIYHVWPDEIKKWDNFKDLKYEIIHGKDKAEALRREADIYLINPEGLLWLLNKDYERWLTHDFDVLCIDESTKFKATNTKRFKLMRPWIPTFKLRWILTGTPMPNGAMDLFGQIYILDLGRALGAYITHFRNKFMYQADYQGYDWQLKPGAFERINDLINPLCVRISAEEALDMPELINNTIQVELPAAAREIYQQVQDDFIALLSDGVVIASNAGAAGTKCRQIANGAVYREDEEWELVHDTKVEALEELMEELGGKPLLLLYEYRHDAERIMELLGDQCFDISGASPTKAKEAIQQFNSGQLPVLLGHPASMGHGLNLQGMCHHVCWFGIPWNLEYYQQAIARVWRQGQENHVIVHHIVAKDTLDEKVVRVLHSKDANQRTLLSALAGD